VALRLIALGHRMPAWIAAGYAEYATRLTREFALELVEIKPEPRDRGRTAAQMLAAEAVRIRTAAAGAKLVALDEHGVAWTTRQLAHNLQQWVMERAGVAFVIGSADGLDAPLKREADVRLALSAMTLPHGLARVLLAEQLYRAQSLIAGHPYHRE